MEWYVLEEAEVLSEGLFVVDFLERGEEGGKLLGEAGFFDHFVGVWEGVSENRVCLNGGEMRERKERVLLDSLRSFGVPAFLLLLGFLGVAGCQSIKSSEPIVVVEDWTGIYFSSNSPFILDC